MNRTIHSNRLPDIHCLMYRCVACLLLGVSIVHLIVICRYFLQRCYEEQISFVSNRLAPILIGMSIGSFLIIFTAEPYILLQCFTCQPALNDNIFCKMHGFMCFSIGLFNMHIVALLSFLRYLSILHKSSWLNQYLEDRRDLSVFICGLISFFWAIPSLFNIGNRYVPEDSGFYCSLKWNDPAISSRLFTISIILFNYILPFFLVIFSNLRVWCVLRHLLRSYHYRQTHSALEITSSLPHGLRKSLIDVQLKETTNRLQRLRIDQRYAVITAIMAAQYLIIWTPYACIVILNLIGETRLIDRHPFLPTLSALFAKISLILNPLILIYTSRMKR